MKGDMSLWEDEKSGTDGVSGGKPLVLLQPLNGFYDLITEGILINQHRINLFLYKHLNS